MANLIPNPWVILGLFVAWMGSLAWVHVADTRAANQRVADTVAAIELAGMKARASRIATVNAKADALQAYADNERDLHAQAEVIALAARARLSRELQQRPTRADGAAVRSDVSARPAGAGPSDCRGARGDELAREDAGVLEGQFNLARLITAQRDACYRKYNAARETLKALAAGR